MCYHPNLAYATGSCKPQHEKVNGKTLSSLVCCALKTPYLGCRRMFSLEPWVLLIPCVGMCNGRSAQQESGVALSKNSMFTAGA